MSQLCYIDVLLPLPLRHPQYTYQIELEEPNNLVGKLVIVPFGTRKTYTGIIVAQHANSPTTGVKIKQAERLLPYPPIPPHIIELWHWIANYYICSVGEVFVAAVPQGFRPDGDQETTTNKALARVIKGFLPSQRLMTDEHFQSYLLGKGLRSNTQREAIRFLLTHYEIGSKAPMTLKDMAEWIGVSPSVLNKLRTAKAIEPAEILSTELPEELLFPQEQMGDVLSEKVHVGSRNIQLIHARHSHLEQRIPYDYLMQVLGKEQQILLLFSSQQALQTVQHSLDQAFGDRIYYYHSGLSAREQQLTWAEALNGTKGIYVGLRSAVLLPFAQLGLVVVTDEESSEYRQHEPAPRYTATNVALMLAHFAHTPTLLISATPSVESYTLALQNKYSFAEVTYPLPTPMIKQVHLPKAYEENRVQARLLSFEMIGAIREAIDEGGLALLYYQRKGFARRATCPRCHTSPTCPHCHTPMRYIEATANLVCGICGYHQPLPHRCPTCGSGPLQLEGTGIERLKRAISELWRGVHVQLEEELDRRRQLPPIVLTPSYYPLLDLQQHATTIGVVQMDLLSPPTDYRANEAAYRFLVKCRDQSPKLKRLVIQHFAETPNALTAFMEDDYTLMLDHELEERHIVQFPPFSRHIDIYFESRAQSEAYALAQSATQLLAQQFPEGSALGPAPMPVHKALTEVGYKVSIFVPLQYGSQQVRQALTTCLEPIIEKYRGPKMNIYYDVDPL